MQTFNLHRLTSAAGLGMAMTDVHAYTAAQIYPGVGDTGVPAALASLVWVPIVVLVFALGIALLWLLRTPATARKVQTSAGSVALRQPRRNRRLPRPALAQHRTAPHRRAVLST